MDMESDGGGATAEVVSARRRGRAVFGSGSCPAGAVVAGCSEVLPAS